ncbi:MAG TPA: HAD family hydrolase [Chitinophagales bacterium]|nr:HAD family hydrolase [Chitinophagales bacterium]
MDSYQNILFDLDGTITDSGKGITNSVAYALRKFDIEIKDTSELRKFIGPPLHDSFVKFYQFSNSDASKAIEYYREYYKDQGIFENYVFNGIEELLKQLKAKDKTLVVATSKPEYFANIIIKHFKLDDYFSLVAGSHMDGTRVNKDEIIQHAMETLQIKHGNHSIMIGDRKFDILGAKHHQMKSIGVLFGFGNHEELEKAGADYIVDTVQDLSDLLLPY